MRENKLIIHNQLILNINLFELINRSMMHQR